MGNSASSSSGRSHHEETVDFGYLTPHGIYTGARDWNQEVVSQLISARRLAPFYRPLEEYNDSWDDEQILAARKEPSPPDPDATDTLARIENTPVSSAPTKSSHSKRLTYSRESNKLEAGVYRGAVECPICFLCYPPNINHSRCCDQAICTECFVQIKRIEPTTTHCVSEPAACPYCVQDNFGIVYYPPPWRSGIGSEMSDYSRNSHSPTVTSYRPTHKRRQKSYGPDSPEVVLTDHIRPDWEAKLAAVRAAVTRRANRRIIMRQVGDRYIPVGVTSGRVHALNHEDGHAEHVDNAGSRRSRRRNQEGSNHNFEFMGMAGQDLEEFMLMEAMRLSLIDHEEHQRKEAEEKKRQAAAVAESEADIGPATGTSSAQPPTESTSRSIPVPIRHRSSQDLLRAPQTSTQTSYSRTRTSSPCSGDYSRRGGSSSPSPSACGNLAASSRSSPGDMLPRPSSCLSQTPADGNVETGSSLSPERMPLDPPVQHTAS